MPDGSLDKPSVEISKTIKKENKIENTALKSLKTLHKENSEAKLWLEIGDINLSEGLVQSPDNEYYLSRNNKKEKDRNGALFIDYEVNTISIPADNLIVYGHNMENHKVFSDLIKYGDKNFMDKAKMITVTTLEGKTVHYEPFLFARVNLEEGPFFPYHTWISWDEEDNAIKYYTGMKRHAIVDKLITLEKDSKLLTLSTCDNALSNARYVVLAREVNKNKDIK